MKFEVEIHTASMKLNKSLTFYIILDSELISISTGWLHKKRGIYIYANKPGKAGKFGLWNFLCKLHQSI